MSRFNPLLEIAQTALLVGDNGSGKTFFCMNQVLAKEGFFLDLEDRYKETLKFHPEIPLKAYDVMRPNDVLGRYTNCICYTQDCDIDKIATFERVEKMMKMVINANVKLIVVDSIEDLRRMAQERWELKNKKSAYGAAAWGEINDDVRNILYKAMNFARIKGFQTIFTTHFSPVYTDDGKLTKEVKIDAKDFITDRVDEIIAFQRKGTSFFLKRGKSPRGPSDLMEWTFDAEEPAKEKPADQTKDSEIDGSQ